VGAAEYQDKSKMWNVYPKTKKQWRKTLQTLPKYTRPHFSVHFPPLPQKRKRGECWK
jgi:hypothetical protein